MCSFPLPQEKASKSKGWGHLRSRLNDPAFTIKDKINLTVEMLPTMSFLDQDQGQDQTQTQTPAPVTSPGSPGASQTPIAVPKHSKQSKHDKSSKTS